MGSSPPSNVEYLGENRDIPRRALATPSGVQAMPVLPPLTPLPMRFFSCVAFFFVRKTYEIDVG